MSHKRRISFLKSQGSQGKEISPCQRKKKDEEKNMVIVEAKEVLERLDMKTTIGLMRDALRDLSAGTALQPLRSIHVLPQGEKFGFMPAYLGSDSYYGAKVVVSCPQNQGTSYPSHSGYVMMFEAAHGTVTGLADAGAITQIRTGAVSAVATDLLARKDADHLAIIGCGAQGRSHLEAIRLVRDIKKVTCYDMFPESAKKYAAQMEETYHIPVEVCQSVEECVKDADIICTVTPSKDAYLKKEWIKPGAHINAVGTFTPNTREVTSELVAASKLYADQVEACKKESGEYLVPLAEGLITEDHIQGAIGDVILGTVEGRTSEEEITLFDALGQAIEDVACGMYLCKEN